MDDNIKNSDIGLNREIFLNSLVKEVAESLETVIGIKNASAVISFVGISIGKQINDAYCKELGISQIPEDKVPDVLVDLKRRINGKFRILEVTNEKIILVNTECPFGKGIKGKPSACMMTSNVFGHIASQSFGYARVDVEESIALGHQGCRVVIYLDPDNEESNGREYKKISTD